MVNDFEQTNYWALILGGSSGLGLATAKKLAAHGMHICIVHRNSRKQLLVIEPHFQEIKALGVQLLTFNYDALNVEKRESILVQLQQTLTSVGKIRVLVHSIAKGNLKPMLSESGPELDANDFGLTINAMAVSLYDWSKAVLRKKMFHTQARIIGFTSEGSTKVWKNYAAVSAAKAALEALIRSMALEFAPYGITANCIQAGVTETEALNKIPGSENLKQYSLLRNPYKRLTTPTDVANVVYLLCKNEAKWINGTVLKVDGGESIS